MEEKGQGTTIIILLVIVGLLVGLVGIGTVIYNLATDSGILGESVSTQAVSPNFNAESVQPKRTNTNKEIDYNFQLDKENPGFNTENFIIVGIKEHEEALARDNDTNQDTATPPQANSNDNGDIAQEGVRDELITTKVENFSKKFQLQSSSIRSIQINKIGINSPVIQGGNGDSALDKGMWLYPTSYTNKETVLLCHRRFFGQTDPRTCWYMDKLQKGDIIKITLKSGKVLKYQVKAQAVRKGTDISIFKASNSDFVKIITCTPLGSSSHRLITIAERI